MKKTYKYIAPFAVILLLIISACGGSNTTTKNKRSFIKTGMYDFALYDTASFKLLDGTLDIKSADKSSLTGEYNVKNQYKDTVPGNLKKSGEFSGQYSTKDSMVSFNMNPKIADANIFMHGTIYNDSITGTWNFSTMRGIKGLGVFKAFYKGDTK
jgi:hypothetical protein